MQDLRRLKPRKILVRMPNWIGDVVMATPVLEDLKREFPQAELTVMCPSPLSELLKYNPHVDELYAFHRGKGIFSRRKSGRNVIRKLHTGNYDLGIVLPNSWSSAWSLWQGNVKFRIGYQGNWRAPLLTHPLRFSAHRDTQHLVVTYKQLLAPLGMDISATEPKLVVLATEIDRAYRLLENHGIVGCSHPIVGINPGAAYGSAKCWIPERFQAVMDSLLALDPYLSILVFGDVANSELVKMICNKFSARVVNLAGQTNLRELMALIKICTVFLTNDSGPMHIADALGTPLLALFGSTNALATGPYIQKNILSKDVACSPCYKRVCPIDFRCMKAIHVQEVYHKLIELLSRNIHV
jgi:heptosyltransferase II